MTTTTEQPPATSDDLGTAVQALIQQFAMSGSASPAKIASCIEFEAWAFRRTYLKAELKRLIPTAMSVSLEGSSQYHEGNTFTSLDAITLNLRQTRQICFYITGDMDDVSLVIDSNGGEFESFAEAEAGLAIPGLREAFPILTELAEVLESNQEFHEVLDSGEGE